MTTIDENKGRCVKTFNVILIVDIYDTFKAYFVNQPKIEINPISTVLFNILLACWNIFKFQFKKKSLSQFMLNEF